MELKSKSEKSDSYYIKYVYGPAGQNGYPHSDGLIHFSNEKTRKRFLDCSGFLLYEVGGVGNKPIGAMTIYAYGFIESIQPETYSPALRGDKLFPYAVKVKIDSKSRVNPKNGIPLKSISKIINSKNMQRKGGMIKITKEQFDELCAELDKRP